MSLSTSIIGWAEYFTSSWWRSSIQMLLPLGLLAILDLSRISLSASTRCWIYRGVFLKVLLVFLFPFTVHLPVLPFATSPVTTQRALSVTEPSGFRAAAAPSQLTTEIVDSGLGITGASWSLRLSVVFFTGWLLGVGFILWRTWDESRMARHYARVGSPNTDDDVQRMLRTLCARLKLARIPELRMTSTRVGPLLVGLVRPVIVIPRWLVASPVELKLAVAHELAHVHRRDLVWNLLVRVVQALFFCNPLVWWLTRRYHVAVEIACDQAALQTTGESRHAYGELLLQSVQASLLPAQGSGLSLALAPFTCLKERLMAIRSSSVDRKCSLLVLMTALAMICVPPITLAQLPSYESKNQSSGTARASSESSVVAQGTATGSGGGRAGGSSGGSVAGFARSSAESSGGGVASGEADGVAGSNHAVGRVSSKASADSRKNKRTDRVTEKKSRVSQFNKAKTRVEVDANADDGLLRTQSSRSVAVHDGETLIEISDTPETVRVKVTKTDEGGEKINLYTAKNVEELKRTSPDGFKLYEKYLLDDESSVDLDPDNDPAPAGGARKAVPANKADEDQQQKFEEFQEQAQQSREQQARRFEEAIKEQRRKLNKMRQDFEQRVREQTENQERLLREFSEQKP